MKCIKSWSSKVNCCENDNGLVKMDCMYRVLAYSFLKFKARGEEKKEGNKDGRKKSKKDRREEGRMKENKE